MNNNKKQMKNNTYVEKIIVNKYKLPIIRAGWANILVPISILFFIIFNYIFIMWDLPFLPRFIILFLGICLLLREYMVHISEIYLYKNYVIFKCSLFNFKFYLQNIKEIIIKTHMFMSVSIIKIKLRKSIYTHKFNLGPSILNNLIFLEGIKIFEDYMTKNNININKFKYMI